MSRAIRGVATLLVGSVAWVIVGYLALIPLGAIFGWSGHPAIPAAPVWVYGGVYLVALPVSCLYAGWRMVKWFAGRIG